MEYKVISADSHIVEPPHLWEKYLEPEFRKFAPKKNCWRMRCVVLGRP